jgi:hypothetical protein
MAWFTADVSESSLQAPFYVGHDEYPAPGAASASSTIGRDPTGHNTETLGLCPRRGRAAVLETLESDWILVMEKAFRAHIQLPRSVGRTVRARPFNPL